MVMLDDKVSAYKSTLNYMHPYNSPYSARSTSSGVKTTQLATTQAIAPQDEIARAIMLYQQKPAQNQSQELYRGFSKPDPFSQKGLESIFRDPVNPVQLEISTFIGLYFKLVLSGYKGDALSKAIEISAVEAAIRVEQVKMTTLGGYVPRQVDRERTTRESPLERTLKLYDPKNKKNQRKLLLPGRKGIEPIQYDPINGGINDRLLPFYSPTTN